MTGKWMMAYEKNLDAKVPWRDPSVKLWGGLTYHLFGEAREGAVVGTDGWLYTTEEFQAAAEDTVEIAVKVEYIRQVRDKLAKDGAHLVVALVPAKTRIYPEHLGHLLVPAVKSNVYENFRQRLEAAGVPAPDLFRAMQAEKGEGARSLFLRTDTHWTPYGAAVAARTLAPAVKALRPDLPPTAYHESAGAPVARRGDLLRYVPVPEGVGPAPDTVREPEYTRTDEGGSGLLGDVTLAVTLVGTSYSAETKDNVWHFGAALAQALGTEVLNAAQEGKGPIVPMREYLSSQDRRDNPPQIVVWEIPERFLRISYPKE
ncbi:alginate O-acetyltransferase AlgX-related protein [Deinococcus apachensis]|uniref:alginate O-acetyltransferase AlgX-related protein n=1 Tax=Deinococcus apachensis TaxID=309886 RepID=UPI0003742FB5|nr:hypothetical protein [Deinococcus apachensis]